MKAFDLHLSNMFGEDILSTAFEYIPALENITDLILDFERTPPLLNEILHQMSFSISKMTSLGHVGLFVTNITKRNHIYQAFVALGTTLVNLQELSLLILDTDKKPFEIEKFGGLFKRLKNLKTLRFELSIANFEGNTHHIEDILRSLPNVENLVLDFDLKSNNQFDLSLPLLSCPQVKNLVVTQRFFAQNWVSKDLTPTISSLSNLETFSFTEPQYGMELWQVNDFIEKLELPETIKKMELCFPIHETKGWDKNRLGRNEFMELRSKLKKLMDKYPCLESVELRTPKVEGLTESIITLMRDMSIEKNFKR